MTEFSAGLTPGSEPSGITLGSDAHLWFTEQAGNRIGEITPAGVITEFAIASASSQPLSITAGPNGTLWFTQPGSGQIGTLLDSNHDYVNKLYENVLGRGASPADKITGFPSCNSRAKMRWQPGSRDRRSPSRSGQPVVPGIPGSVAGSDEHPYFTAVFQTDTQEQVLGLLILSSPAYYNRAPLVPGVGGGSPTDTTFLQAVYENLLGHAASAADVASWLGQLQSQGDGVNGRMAVVQRIEGSLEYRTDFIQDQYLNLLHRTGPASQPEVNYWLAQNLDGQSLQIAFEQTAEFAATWVTLQVYE